MNHRFSSVTLALLGIAVAGCSSVSDVIPDSKKVEYKSAGKVPTLEVPPDLSQVARDDRYAVPDAAGKGSATFSAYSADRTPAAQAQNTESHSCYDRRAQPSKCLHVPCGFACRAARSDCSRARLCIARRLAARSDQCR